MRSNTFPTVVALSGQTGSGKTMLARGLAQHIGASIASFGSFVRSEARHRGVAGDRISLQSLGQSLIDEFGAIEFTKKVLDSAEGDNTVFTILDGVRSVEVWQAVQTIASKSVLIYLDIEEQKQINRLIERDNLSQSYVALVMQHQMEANIPELKLHADLILSECFLNDMIFDIINMLVLKGIKISSS